MGHANIDYGVRSIATVAMDYFSVTRSDVYNFEEWRDEKPRQKLEEGALKVMVVRDLKSKASFAHAVEAEGADERGFIVDAMEKMSYG